MSAFDPDSYINGEICSSISDDIYHFIISIKAKKQLTNKKFTEENLMKTIFKLCPFSKKQSI